MSLVKRYTAGTWNPLEGIRAGWYAAKYLLDNPEYFAPDGIWTFCGPQGCGKTLSAVQTARKIAKDYPAARVIANFDFDLGEGRRPEEFTDYDMLVEADNGIRGIIFVLDEIHVLWNSLESKNIPISEMSALCQMRKSRRLILGTSQVYGRIAKPIREQLKYVILCHNFLRVLQVNEVCDPAESVEINGNIHPEIVSTKVWFHSPELYKAYETLDKIKRIDRTAKQYAGVYRG